MKMVLVFAASDSQQNAGKKCGQKETIEVLWFQFRAANNLFFNCGQRKEDSRRVAFYSFVFPTCRYKNEV